jgi:DNA-binding protein
MEKFCSEKFHKMEVAVKQHSVMSHVIGFCESKMSESGFSGLTLVADGKAVNKAISIHEILTRKHARFTSEISLSASPSNPDEPSLRITVSQK